MIPEVDYEEELIEESFVITDHEFRIWISDFIGRNEYVKEIMAFVFLDLLEGETYLEGFLKVIATENNAVHYDSDEAYDIDTDVSWGIDCMYRRQGDIRHARDVPLYYDSENGMIYTPFIEENIAYYVLYHMATETNTTPDEDGYDYSADDLVLYMSDKQEYIFKEACSRLSDAILSFFSHISEVFNDSDEDTYLVEWEINSYKDCLTYIVSNDKLEGF